MYGDFRVSDIKLETDHEMKEMLKETWRGILKARTIRNKYKKLGVKFIRAKYITDEDVLSKQDIDAYKTWFKTTEEYKKIFKDYMDSIKIENKKIIETIERLKYHKIY